MARKKNEEKEKNRPVPIDDVKWLVQPIEVTMMKGELSPLEVNIIVEVVESLQDNLQKQVKEKMSGKQLTLFDFQDEPILIDLSKFGVLPCDYWRLDEAAKKLSDFKIYHRFKDERGNWVDGYSVVFPDAGISKSSLKRDGTAYKYKGGSRAVGYMRITVNKTVAPYLLNINKEYTRYIKAATRGRKCMYTPRMVMFISSYRERGIWKIDYDEFRRLIGLLYNEEIDIMDADTRKSRKQIVEMEKKGYAKFSDVKRRIIDPARDEMKEMCENKIMDCYFEYEPIFPKGKTRGLPQSLMFYIHKGPLGVEYDAKKETNKELALIGKRLQEVFGLPKTSVRTIMNKVNNENRERFKIKMEEVADYIAKKGKDISSPEGYAYSSLMEYLNSEHMQQSSEDNKTPTQDNTPNAENVCKLSPNEEPKEINGRWDGALGEMQLNIQSKDMEYILSDLQYVSFEADVLTLSTPPGNKFFEQWITQQWNYREQYLAAVRSHFGENVRVVYVMRKF